MPVPDPTLTPLLTVAEVAAIPGMPCERTIREAIACGEFPHRRIRRRIVIPTVALRRWLDLDDAPAKPVMELVPSLPESAPNAA